MKRFIFILILLACSGQAMAATTIIGIGWWYNDPNLVAWYKFNDTSGTAVIDTQGMVYNTSTGGVKANERNTL